VGITIALAMWPPHGRIVPSDVEWVEECVETMWPRQFPNHNSAMARTNLGIRTVEVTRDLGLIASHGEVYTYERFRMSYLAIGWPLHWVSGAVYSAWLERDRVTVPFHRVAVPSPRSMLLPQGTYFRLPYGVHYGNAAANVAITGIALWAVAVVGGVVRGAWRAWRGQCARCGYSLAGLADGAACPECGGQRGGLEI
jgi:hypothetical protein